MLEFLYNTGRYIWFLGKVFSKPEKWRIYIRQLFLEFEKLGINSLGIVVIISIFSGGVIALQTAYNITNPLIPTYMVGLTTRDSIILEFSSTMLCLILAGKVGSNIASEIGTMKVTEQIEALEIMGINSAAFLVLPKIVAFVFIVPILVVLSMFFGISGGYFVVSVASHIVNSENFIYGVHYAFQPFYVTYSLIKSSIFAFLIVSISAYYGYFTTGGALEVGRSSTKAVVYSSIAILVANLLVTQILLS